HAVSMIARLRRFGRDRRGATAVEFAMVAAPFFFMMFAILEIGVVFMISNQLENATMAAGRLVRTGQSHQQGMDAAGFKAAVCDRIIGFTNNCADKLSIDVRVIPRFENPNPPDPMSSGTFRENGLTFDDG